MLLAFLVIGIYGNKQIAEELYISETTVKKHVTYIYEKRFMKKDTIFC